jgi:hypothetical protein
MLYLRPRSAAGLALRVYVERIDRAAGGHEQAIALQAAETEIGASFGQGDEADRFAGRIEDFHPILLRIAHAPTTPQIAIDVDAEAIGSAARLGGDENPTVGELVVIDVVGADEARIGARFDNLESLLIGREREPIRTVDVACDHRGTAGL